MLTGALVVLGFVYFVTRGNDEAPTAPSRPQLWSAEFDELSRLSIELPLEGLTQAWVRHEDEYWYFDEVDGPRVDMSRWGGGVPLLMSAPRANRSIARDATDEEFSVYGLDKPSTIVSIETIDDRSIVAEIGDATPDGNSYYLRMSGSRNVFAIDHTWVELLEGLVRNPPYPEG